jgi:hypothetical protein
MEADTFTHYIKKEAGPSTFAERRAELKRRLPPNAHPRSRVRATQDGVWIKLSHSQMRILYRLFLDQLVLTITCRPIGGRDSKPLAYLDAILDHARRESSAKEMELIHRQESRRAQEISALAQARSVRESGLVTPTDRTHCRDDGAAT